MRRNLAHGAGVMLLLVVGLVLQPAGQRPSEAAAALDDWPMFLHDVARSSFNPNEVRLSVANAQNLKLKWKYTIPGVIAAQPIVVGDMVYVGAWDGFLYALDRETGTLRWKIELGRTSGSGNICLPSSAGIT